MENDRYQLKELLWEFNLDCNKNCSYCGSKQLLNKSKLSQKIMYQIRKCVVENICEANPQSVTITGGEPSIHIDQLVECIGEIKSYNPFISVKLLTNGNVFLEGYHEILYKLVDCIGISINEPEDVKQFYSYLGRVNMSKTTMITNFGQHNLEHLQLLMKTACLFRCWQVQLTMKDQLYLSLDQLESLNCQLNDLKRLNIVDVVFADNFNNSPCLAGKYGCAITFDGYVVPCLSQRAWRANVEKVGSLYKTDDVFVKDTLKNIWETKFEKHRLTTCPCCKDFTGIKQLNDPDITAKRILETAKKRKQKKDSDKEIHPSWPPLQPEPVYVYGVVTPPDSPWRDIVVTYGVAEPDITKAPWTISDVKYSDHTTTDSKNPKESDKSDVDN